MKYFHCTILHNYMTYNDQPNRPFHGYWSHIEKGADFMVGGRKGMKIRENIYMFPSNCSVTMIHSRTFETNFTSFLKICPLINMAAITVKGPI